MFELIILYIFLLTEQKSIVTSNKIINQNIVKLNVNYVS